MISSEYMLDAELRQIKQVFFGEWLPECIITTTTGLKIAKFNAVKVFSSSKYLPYMQLHWVGPSSQLHADKISSIRRSFNECSSPVFPSVRKNVLPTYPQSLVVYKYKCHYAGKTTLRLEVRITAKHVPGQIRRRIPVTSWPLRAHESAVSKHLLNSFGCRSAYSGDFFVLHMTRMRCHHNREK